MVAPTPAPALTARRVPKRARKVPKKSLEQKTGGNLLVLLAFAGGLLLVRFFGPAIGLAFAMLCGALLLLLYIGRWARRREEALRAADAGLQPRTRTR